MDVYTPSVGGSIAPPPSPNTQPATAVGLDSATLNASVNPHGNAITDCHFEYTDDADFQANGFSGAQSAPCSPSPGSGSTAVAVSADISGLTAGTSYDARVVVGDAQGTFDGGTVSFATDEFAFSDAATAIHHVDATLHGHFDPQGLSAFEVADCSFEWGTDTSYGGGSVPCAEGNSFSSAASVSALLPGLHPGTTYHFRLHVDTASAGEYTGADKSFTTVAFPIEVNAATNLHHTDLTLNGHFNPEGDPALDVTECHFDWGLTTSYSGGSVPCAEGNSFSSAASVSAFLNNLNPGIGYHVRLRLNTAGAGEVSSADRVVNPSAFQTTAPTEVAAVGSDGTAGSSFAGGPGKLAFDQANQRLYVETGAGIYGFDASAPPALSAVSGFNPLAAPAGREITVDNSSTASAEHLYLLTSEKVYGFDSSGTALGGNFPIDVTANPDFLPSSHPCGMAVDSTGRIWVSDEAGANAAPLLRYGPNGARQSSLNAFFPCVLAFNAGDDLYEGHGGGQGDSRRDAPTYTQTTGLDVNQGGNTNQIAVDSSTGTAYIDAGQVISAWGPDNSHSYNFGDGVPSSQLTGVAVDPTSHYVYVSDEADHKVHIFAPGDTLAPPTITTQPPSAISGDSVTLNAKVDPEGFQVTDCHFEVVPNSQFEASGFTEVTPAEEHPCAANPGSGSGDVAVHADVSGLEGGATYHSRIVAKNAQPGGTATGPDQAFETLGPRLTEVSASHISDTGARLSASVNPEGLETTYQFQYVDDAGFQANGFSGAQSVPAAPSLIGSGNTLVPVHQDLTGLSPSTEYHFRIVAHNSDASVTGQGTFTTYVSGPGFEPCPNEQFRGGASAKLPDCRAYEQVSPVDKHGANVLTSRAFAQVAADGNAVTFAGIAGLPTASGGSSEPAPVLAHRGPSGWVTGSFTPVLPVAHRISIAGWNADLTRSVSVDPFTGDFYVGNLSTGTWTSPFSASGSISGFGAQAGAFSADPDRFLLESPRAFTPDAVDLTGLTGAANLYEYDHGTLSLADRAPVPPASSCDDSGGPACAASPHGVVSLQQIFGKATISADGSKVVFAEQDTHRIYMRLDGAETVQVSASQKTNGAGPGGTDPNGQKPARLEAVGKDGSVVYFSSCEQLTDDSTAVSTAADECGGSGQGSDLYAYHTSSGQLTDLTVDSSADPLDADVQAMVGASPDGSYVYFAANGRLAPGAPAGNCRFNSATGTGTGSCQLYLSHDGGAPVDVARISLGDVFPGNSYTARPAQVAEDGTLALRSVAPLTAYDNTGPCNLNQGANTSSAPCAEIYRYHPGDAGVTCVSCDPTGAPPSASTEVDPYDPSASFVHGALTGEPLPSFVSADGNQVFFQTADKLVGADDNGDAGCDVRENEFHQKTGVYHCQDVYEWEADGSGSCRSSAQNGGCVYLLSTGTSADPAWLVGASASGDDVFIRTTDQLVPQDQDQLYDVYDVRVGGGLASQNQVQAPPCGSSEQCRSAGTEAPAGSGAGSAAFSGPGNQPAQEKQRKKHHRKKRHHRHSRHHRKASSNKGGSK